MQTAKTFIIHTSSAEQVNALKAFMKALKIKFEVAEKQYNPEFVEKIKRSEDDFKNGKFTRVNKEDLQNFLGLK